MTDKQRDYLLRRRYNLSLEERNKILEFQYNECAICHRLYEEGKRWSVDHDHETGLVRGILCLTCNKYKLGNMTYGEAHAIMEYLEDPPARKALGGPRYVPEDMRNPKKTRKKRRKVGSKKSKPKSSNSNRTSSG